MGREAPTPGSRPPCGGGVLQGWLLHFSPGVLIHLQNHFMYQYLQRGCRLGVSMAVGWFPDSSVFPPQRTRGLMHLLLSSARRRRQVSPRLYGVRL